MPGLIWKLSNNPNLAEMLINSLVVGAGLFLVFPSNFGFGVGLGSEFDRDQWINQRFGWRK